MRRKSSLGSFATLGADPVAPVAPVNQTTFDKIIGNITALTNSATQGYNIYTGRVPVQPVKPATDWSKVLLYGGVALLGITLLMKKRR